MPMLLKRAFQGNLNYYRPLHFKILYPYYLSALHRYVQTLGDVPGYAITVFVLKLVKIFVIYLEIYIEG